MKLYLFESWCVFKSKVPKLELQDRDAIQMYFVPAEQHLLQDTRFDFVHIKIKYDFFEISTHSARFFMTAFQIPFYMREFHFFSKRPFPSQDPYMQECKKKIQVPKQLYREFKNRWGSGFLLIQIIVSWLKKYNRNLFTKELLRLHKFTVNDFRVCFHTNSFYKQKEIIKKSERFPKEILKKCCLGNAKMRV